MADPKERIRLLEEGERRGLLNEEEQALLTEARRRALASRPSLLEQFVAGVQEGTAGFSEFVQSGVESVPGPIGIASRLSRQAVEQTPASPEGQREALRESASRTGEPVTTSGKIARTVGEFTPGTLAAGGPVAAISSTPIRTSIAELASLFGAAGGSVKAEEIAPDSPTAQIAGTLIGGFSPQAVQKSVSVATKRLLAGAREGAEETVATFERAGTTPSAGEATGRSRLQFVEQTLGATPGSQGKIARFAGQRQEDIGRRVQGRVDDLSAGASAEQAGEAIQTGISNFMTRFRVNSRKLFGNLFKQIPQEQRVGVQNYRKALDDILEQDEGVAESARLLSNTTVARLKKAIEKEAPDGTVSFRNLQTLRSLIGRKLASSSLVDDIPKGELKRLYGALSDDIRSAAEKQGPEAVKAFERANNFYKARLDRIEKVLEKASKKATPEEAFTFAQQGAKEGGTRLRKLKASLTPEEWKIFSAAVIQRMGRATPSKQDDLSEVFSTETFLTNWNRMSKEAKRSLFSGTELAGVRQELDDIASTAATIREGAEALANPSGTAQRGANIMTLGAIGIGSGTGAALGGPGTALVVPLVIGGFLGTTRGMASLMTSPKFVKWLAKGTKLSGEQIPSHVARLGTVLEDSPQEVQIEAAQYMDAIQRVINSGLQAQESAGTVGQESTEQRGLVQ